MTTSTKTIVVSDIPVDVTRKPIKAIRLAVMPPDGRVRLSVPMQLSAADILAIITSRVTWIRNHQSVIRQRYSSELQNYQSGERHYFSGRPCVLKVQEHSGKHKIILNDEDEMIMHIRSGVATESRARLMQQWYKTQLNEMIAELLTRWCPVINKSIASWSVRQMKTRWGSCNITNRKITLNLELAKRPLECLEYVVVHELVHLHERYHNHHFRQLMDGYLPDWRERKVLLDNGLCGTDGLRID